MATMKMPCAVGSGGGYIDKKITPSTDQSTSITVDFSDVSGYQNLTEDNFSIVQPMVWTNTTASLANVTYSYDSSTGILTATLVTNAGGTYFKWNTREIIFRCSR